MTQEILTLNQGATFRKGWTLYEGDDVVKSIASITLGYPTVLTVTSHGLPDGVIPVAIVNVSKLETSSVEPDDRIVAKKIDSNTLSINVDSSDYSAYVSGGYLVYTPPKDLTGYTAQAQARKKISSTTPYFTLTDTDGITLGGIEGTVDVEISDERTALVPDKTCYMQVELIAPDGSVERPIDIKFTLSKEVTR